MVTKKEMNELEEKYDALMQEALAIQEVAKDRLVLLKVFESFLKVLSLFSKPVFHRAVFDQNFDEKCVFKLCKNKNA